MTVSQNIDTGLSPLDQIRQTEAEVTRQIAAARERTELDVAKVGTQAREIINEARQSGRSEGQARYREIISKAEEDAHVMIALANKQAEDLHRKGDRLLDTAMCLAVNIILGEEDE
jgi:vacuolar-type H+-ATPase subunit H